MTEATTYQPTTTWHPSATWFPTVTPMPTVSAFPTRGESDPTGAAPPTSSGTESPSSSPSEVKEDTPSDETRSIAPSSLIDHALDNFIQDGIENRPAPTISLSPSVSSSATPATPPPSSSFPASSHPTGTFYPTDTWSPSATWYPTASSTPTASPFPSADETTSSVGYGHSCDTSGNLGIEERLVFTFLAESTVSSPGFLSELEVHLVDFAASNLLSCSQAPASIPIYGIKYADQQVASDATTCVPSRSTSRSCWIIQTHMYIRTNREFLSVAKQTVLAELQVHLNDEDLSTNTFRDLTYTRYLGPDPVGVSVAESGSGRQHSPIFYIAMISVVLAILSIFLFVGLIWYTRRNRQNPKDTLSSASEQASIEITELLTMSRERTKAGMPQQGYRDDNLEESEVFEDEISTKKREKEHGAVASGTSQRSLSGASASSSTSREKRTLNKQGNDQRRTSKSSLRAPKPAAARYRNKSKRLLDAAPTLVANEPPVQERSSLTRSSNSPKRDERGSKRQPKGFRSGKNSLFDDPEEQVKDRRVLSKGDNSKSRNQRSFKPVDKSSEDKFNTIV